MRREAEGKLVQWSLHTRVLASLIRAGCTLEVEYRMTGVVREDALAQEGKEILELVSAGHVLANIQKNPQRPTSPEHVVDWALARCGRAST